MIIDLGILYDIGIISEDKVIEVQRQNLVGQHIGSTAIKTEAIIEKALGSVLFIDEAYRLNNPNCEKDFGVEAVETLMHAMHPSTEGMEHPVMIFAGYSEPMGAFIEMNEGIARRIGLDLKFRDYNCYESAEITELKLASLNLNYPVGDMDIVFSEIYSRFPGEIRRKYNASLCDRQIDQILFVQEAHLDPESVTKNELMSLTLQDVYIGGEKAITKLEKSETLKFRSVGTQAPEEVTLTFPGIGLVFGSP